VIPYRRGHFVSTFGSTFLKSHHTGSLHVLFVDEEVWASKTFICIIRRVHIHILSRRHGSYCTHTQQTLSILGHRTGTVTETPAKPKPQPLRSGVVGIFPCDGNEMMLFVQSFLLLLQARLVSFAFILKCPPVQNCDGRSRELGLEYSVREGTSTKGSYNHLNSYVWS
jgi:hypothetical protein